VNGEEQATEKKRAANLGLANIHRLVRYYFQIYYEGELSEFRVQQTKRKQYKGK